MSPESRKRAEFFARLASLPQLDGIPTSYAAQLLEGLVELGYEWLKRDSSIRERLRGLNRFFLKSDPTNDEIQEFRQKLPLVVLHELHRDSRHLIGGLLNNGQVDLSSQPHLNKIVISLDPENRTTLERAIPPDPQYEMLVDLVRLIRLKNFPFARCQVCPTIFVPVKNQKFCSANCLQKANAETRPEKKREYMKKYMRKRRSEQAKPKKAERNP